ncbi:ABC-type multidrug transport system ATPase subunit [Pseudoalteromonas sp. MBR-15]
MMALNSDSSMGISDPQCTSKPVVAHIELNCSEPVTQQLDCQLKTLQITVLLAPSGTGKSSLFNAIAGVAPAFGGLKVTGQQQLGMPAHKRRIAYVTQSPLLFDHLSIAALLKLVAKQQAQPFDISWAIDPLGLTDKLVYRAHQLSGGQRQRVALLLAMIKGAPLLLLDEVLTGLDQINKQACIGVIKDYLCKVQGAALLACHQLDDVLALADSCLLQHTISNSTQWQMFPVDEGVERYQQQLLESQSSENIQGSQFTSMFYGQVHAHFPALGLTEYHVGGQRCFAAYNSEHQIGRLQPLILKANRLGLSKTALPESSFVNQLKVRITAFYPVNMGKEQGMLVKVRLANSEQDGVHKPASLHVWITRLSFNQLQPKLDETWFLIGKADALHG